MITITQDRYEYEVRTFVWDFLFRVVVVSLTMTTLFTAMADDFLGLSAIAKSRFLIPQLGLTATVFILQVGIMMIIHAVVAPGNYRKKSQVVFGVACFQFICVVLSLLIFVMMLDPHPRSQIQIFHWVLLLGLIGWDAMWFGKYAFDVNIYSIDMKAK